jgi:hypothetical protein
VGVFGTKLNLSDAERERRRLSIIKNGIRTGPTTEEWKRKISIAMKGKKKSPEAVRKCADALRGRKMSPEQVRVHGITMIGRNVGKKRTPEMRMHLSLMWRGEKSKNWRGGLNKQPYAAGWRIIRSMARERDHDTCQVCYSSGGRRRLSVHHIDYNRENNSPDNLITLCGRCHGLTGFNRDLWIVFFNNLSRVTPPSFQLGE